MPSALEKSHGFRGVFGERGTAGVSDEQVEAKSRNLAGHVMAVREVEALISAVRGLDTPTAVGGLSGALRNSARALAA